MAAKIKVDQDKFEVEVDVVMAKEGEYFIAYVPSLNLISHSKEEKEAEKGIDDAIELFLKAWKNSDKLTDKLKSLGWTKTDHKMAPENMSVPYNLLKTMVSQKRVPVSMPQVAAC